MKDWFGKQQNQRIYLDYAAATPVSKSVLQAMQPYFSATFHNPSSIHQEGVSAKEALETARQDVATVLSVKKDEVYFTNGGTESINIALVGVGRFFLHDDSFAGVPHIITTSIEHPAVLESVAQLEKEGCEVTYVDPDEQGIVDSQAVAAAVQKNTVLVSVGLINGEIGTIQSLRKISSLIQEKKKTFGREKESYPYVHTDAAQAPLIMNVQREKYGVDMMSLDTGKMYGPRAGILMKRNYVPIEPILYGGAQERGLRAGTENVAYAIGAAVALKDAQAHREIFSAKMRELQLYFIEQLSRTFPECQINGSQDERSPLNVNVCFPGVQAEFFVLQLDAKGVAVSAMTACKNLDDLAYSYVIEKLDSATENESECAGSSIRCGFGHDTTKQQLDAVIGVMKKLL